MSDERLLREIAHSEDIAIDEYGIPRAAWSPERALAEVGSRISDSGLQSSEQPARFPRWATALAGFTVALVIGGVAVLFTANQFSATEDLATTIGTTPTSLTETGPTTVPPTTVPPTTVVDGGEPIPAEQLATVDDFFVSISAADISTFEGLFAPGGEYEVDSTSGASPDSIEVGSPGLRGFIDWWYGMLRMELRALDCSVASPDGVTCYSETSGVAVLSRPGGVATGFITFTFGPDGLVRVHDRIERGSADSGFDLRGFWQVWMPEGAPEVERLWPGGNGEPPYTAEMARAILEYYPPYLDASGIEVPAEYLDGTLLENLTGDQ